MIFIIVYVGRLFYNNGRVFILGLFKGDEAQTDHLNKILLLAYYLFNLGYAFANLRYWEHVTDVNSVIASLAQNISLLILILAVTHYFNMALIYYLSKKHNIVIHL
ncbi:MAG: hypothetical protein EOP51_10285 [Sphingobacteriales bacterium]|nr:MAG: hypothetical protein EOP51_10285 [Sphingobacteriales bacterium]